MSAADPNWAEQVTAVATAVGAIGLVSALGAAVFAGIQVRETRRATQVALAADFIRRWNEDPLVDARRLINQFADKDDLRTAFQGYLQQNAVEAYVLMRELDYFEQLGALEQEGALSFKLVERLVGRLLVDRWELWEPAIRTFPDARAYPLFEALASKMKRAREGTRDRPARNLS